MYKVRIRRWLWVFVFGVGVTMAWVGHATQDSIKPLAPKVVLTSPVGGWTSSRFVTVAGHISDLNLNRAILLINGSPQGLSVSRGQFSTKIILGPGSNTLRVIAQNGYGVGIHGVTVFARVPSKALEIIMAWDTNDTNISMSVTEPKGETCSGSHKQTKMGGLFASGARSQTYTLSHAVPGPYQVIVQTSYRWGGIPAQVRLEVIRNEGTTRESRRIYRGLLTKSGQELRVAVINIQ